MIKNYDGKTLIRYDTLENWNTVNPVLAKGEFVIATSGDKTYQKCGDGIKTFTELPIINSSGDENPLSINTTGEGNAVTDISLLNNVMSVKRNILFATRTENNLKQDAMTEVTNEQILAIINS